MKHSSNKRQTLLPISFLSYPSRSACSQAVGQVTWHPGKRQSVMNEMIFFRDRAELQLHHVLVLTWTCLGWDERQQHPLMTNPFFAGDITLLGPSFDPHPNPKYLDFGLMGRIRLHQLQRSEVSRRSQSADLINSQSQSIKFLENQVLYANRAAVCIQSADILQVTDIYLADQPHLWHPTRV